MSALRPIRFLQIAAIVCLATVVCSGCGLVYVPRIENSPGNFDQIEVRDQKSGELIGNAAVDYLLLNVTYERGHPLDRYPNVNASTGEQRALSSLEQTATRERVWFGYIWWGGTTAPYFMNTEYPLRGLPWWDVSHVQTTEVAAGRFSVKETKSLAWDHILWPIELPLSDSVWPHIHQNVIVAKAPGYLWENINFPPGKAGGEAIASDDWLYNRLPSSSGYKLNGRTLVIYLGKQVVPQTQPGTN